MPYADINQPPKPLPQANIKIINPTLSLQAPLTRRGGSGPGVIVIIPEAAKGATTHDGVPSPLLKWAEEGYCVAEVTASSDSNNDLEKALEALKESTSCEPKGKVGLVVYDTTQLNNIIISVSSLPAISAIILYDDSTTPALPAISTPLLLHTAGPNPLSTAATKVKVKQYTYPSQNSSQFATPFTSSWHYNLESVSHTRNLTFLKPLLGGPYFDLEDIWDEHTYYEFADRSVQHTMSTMVQEPYVNHVPTITGGVGRAALTQFYAEDFIFSNSSDAELELISRTIGIDRIVDEFIFKFTHDQVVPWMQVPLPTLKVPPLPGVPPTGKRVETPFTAVVNVRGDRLYHEHILWDQASVLRQLGLLPEYLPYPYAVTNTKVAEALEGETVEYRLPVAGKETSDKMRDRSCMPSNEMFAYQVRTFGGGENANGMNGTGESNGVH